MWYYGNQVKTGLVVFQAEKIKAPNCREKFYEANNKKFHCIHGPFASKEEARIHLKMHTPIRRKI